MYKPNIPDQSKSLTSLKSVLDHPTLFVTGTDTEVGKTVVSQVILKLWRKERNQVCAVKPIATGCKRENDRWINEDAQYLLNACEGSLYRDIYKKCGESPGDPFEGFLNPLGPVSAARIEGRKLDIMSIEKRLKKMAFLCYHQNVNFLIEGVGGPLVPLAHNFTVADWIARLKVPAVLVTRTQLGTISHTLMAFECLRDRGIKVAAIIASRQHGGDLTTTEISSLAEIRENTTGIPMAVLDYTDSKFSSPTIA